MSVRYHNNVKNFLHYGVELMKIILLFVVFLVFGVLWNIIINKYLPTILTDVKNKKYDERQSQMVVEIFAKTLLWTVFSLIVAVLLKVCDFTDSQKNVFTRFFSNYPELHYLILISGFLIIFYYHTKKKYSA